MKKNLRIVLITVIFLLLSVAYSYSDTASANYDKVYDTDNSEYKNSGIVFEGTIEQNITMQEKNFTGIMVKAIVTGDVSQVILEYQIQDISAGQTLVSGEIPAVEFKNDKFKKIKFDTKIEKSNGSQYKILLKQKNATAENGLGLYYVSSDDKDNGFQIQGQKTEGTLLMKTLTQKFNVERFIVLLVFIVYIIVFLKILYKLFK